MRFQQNVSPSDAAKWTRRTMLKNVAVDSDVVHHNTLNATGSSDEATRSREVERFFDLMTPTPAQPIAREIAREIARGIAR